MYSGLTTALSELRTLKKTPPRPSSAVWLLRLRQCVPTGQPARLRGSPLVPSWVALRLGTSFITATLTRDISRLQRLAVPSSRLLTVLGARSKMRALPLLVPPPVPGVLWQAGQDQYLILPRT